VTPRVYHSPFAFDPHTDTLDLGVCTADLTQAQADLAACQAQQAVFPGDGVDGPALSYTDNGDGTVTDNNTLLMWEKKDTAGGIHDVNNAYDWNNSFAVFLAALNTNPCFAGHCDWRIPNVKELQSIVDYSKTNPATSFPGATAAAFYWSSSPFAANSSHAWFVFFADGLVNSVVKDPLATRPCRARWPVIDHLTLCLL